jgi:hypothetical protein
MKAFKCMKLPILHGAIIMNFDKAALTTLILLPCLLTAQVFAEERGHRSEHGRGGEHARGFEGGWHGEISRFHEHDLQRWSGGRWRHGKHDGRLGWWWIVGGAWYFYPIPVYPYPDPYQPPLAPLPTPPQYWYYCANPAGYYPYVAQCLVNWQRVPATVAPAPMPPAPLPPQ